MGDDARYFQISVPVQPGNSGGALVDERGNVVGVVSAKWSAVSSVRTRAAFVVGGLTLMILPTMIVGNELLILGGVALAVGGWFLAHRHGQLRGMVDANKNGLDDRIEAALANLRDDKSPGTS